MAGHAGGHAEWPLHADHGENEVQVSETDYKTYVILYMQNVNKGLKTSVLALYGTPSPSAPRSRPCSERAPPWAGGVSQEPQV